MLTKKQETCLKVLKRAPKTTTKAYEQLIKTKAYMTKQAIRQHMRRLENDGLVRARDKFEKKLGRNLIVWELTAKGRKALEK